MIKLKRFVALTLAEIMLAFFIIGIVSSVVISSTQTRVEDATNSNMTYAIFTSIKTAVAEWNINNSPVNWASVNVCNILSATINTIPIKNSSGTFVSNCTATGNVTTGFKTATPSLILANGARVFNATTTASGGFYNIYVDIDGPRRNGLINADVLQFRINSTTGEVLPAPASVAANDTRYITAGYRYFNNTSWITISSNTTLRQAACASGIVTGTFCLTSPAITKNTTCNTYTCEYYLVKPSGLN